jgi:hypothetical protein
MTTGIYKLSFSGTNKVYIGKSKNIYSRFIKHKYSMRSNRASVKLQQAYNTYGSPKIELLFECTEQELDELEAAAIEVFDSIVSGFNKMPAYKSDNKYCVGENSANSKYTNIEILEAFNYLINNPELTYEHISEMTGVGVSTIGMIACGQQHTWIKNSYQEDYELLLQKKNLRNSIQEHPQLPKIIRFIKISLESPELTIKEAANLVGLSENIAASVCAGRTSAVKLKLVIPDDYYRFMLKKFNRSIVASKTTAKAKGIHIPSIKNIVTGEEVSNIENIAEFCRQRNLTASALGQVLKGIRKSHKNWILNT